MGIEAAQGLGVGELGKCAAGKIAWGERSGTDAEQPGAEGRVGIAILARRIEGRDHGHASGFGPSRIVRAESFAVGVADERGAIVDFGGTGAGSLKVLRLGEEGEPAAKGHAVAVVVQAEEVGGAVLKGVGGSERGGQPERGGRGNWGTPRARWICAGRTPARMRAVESAMSSTVAA